MTTNQDASATPAVTKEEAKRFRMSELNLQNESIANYLGTEYLQQSSQEKAVDALLETRENNKLLTKVIIGLIVCAFLLTAAVFGVSIAAGEMAKETTMDPSMGFVTVKNAQDSLIVRTAEAIVSSKPNSIHGMSKEGLADLVSVSFQDRAMTFQVKGYDRTESKTMLLVEGGVLTFDDTGFVDFTGDLPSLVVQPFGHEGKGKGRKLRPSSYPLPDGAKCSSEIDCLSLRCSARVCGGLPSGEPCRSHNDCNSWFCNPYEGLICSKKVPNEEPCIDNRQCKSGYCFILETGSACKDYGHLQNDGEPCNSSNQCHSGFCSDGTCSQKVSNGEPCSNDEQCRGGICNRQGICGKFADGESCENNYQCQLNMCNSNRKCGLLADGESCVPSLGMSYEREECQTKCNRYDRTCGYSDRCKSRRDCRHNEQCTSGGYCGLRNVGQTCEEDSDCRDPNLCINNLCGLNTLADGSLCQRHEECATEHCNFCSHSSCFRSYRRCGKSPNGSVCRQPNDCISGKCEWGGCRD